MYQYGKLIHYVHDIYSKYVSTLSTFRQMLATSIAFGPAITIVVGQQ